MACGRPTAASSRSAGMGDAPLASMLMPPVSRYMTAEPRTIGPNDKLSAARRLMSSRHLRHLPVVEHDALVGILSDRDVFPVHPLHDIHVADAMTENVATARRETPIDQVIELMEDRKCSSVVILGDSGIEGIFTVSDALRALGDVLRRNVENEP